MPRLCRKTPQLFICTTESATNFDSSDWSDSVSCFFFFNYTVILFQCPGKNAIFSNLSLNLNKLEKNKKYLIFKVNKFDARIDLFEINTKGFIEISLKSFFKKIK